MTAADQLRFIWQSVSGAPLRSLLTSLGISIGIAAVTLLTAIGSGVQQFVLAEFTQFGTHLIAITPGKASTTGISGALINSTDPLTLEDAAQIRTVTGVVDVVPMIQGNVEIETRQRQRRTTLYGVGPAMPEVWQIHTGIGHFLPDDSAGQSRPLAALGSKTAHELYPDSSPLGQRIRINGEPFRVVGVMQPKGQMLGFDLDDAIYIPTQRALNLFNRDGLMEIDVRYQENQPASSIAERIRKLLLRRHGKEDFTLITQEEMLSTLGNIMDVLTVAVGALGGISIFVGGIGILTIMSISVRERTGEIGLLRALGATRQQINRLFLTEALVLGSLGGISGVAFGLGIASLVQIFIPALPLQIDWRFISASLGISVITGLLAGIGPAIKAARLTPVMALRSE